MIEIAVRAGNLDLLPDPWCGKQPVGELAPRDVADEERHLAGLFTLWRSRKRVTARQRDRGRFQLRVLARERVLETGLPDRHDEFDDVVGQRRHSGNAAGVVLHRDVCTPAEFDFDDDIGFQQRLAGENHAALDIGCIERVNEITEGFDATGQQAAATRAATAHPAIVRPVEPGVERGVQEFLSGRDLEPKPAGLDGGACRLLLQAIK